MVSLVIGMPNNSLKECLGPVDEIQFLNSFSDELEKFNLKQIVANEGYYISKNKFPVQWCFSLKELIDDLARLKGVEFHYNNSEARVWDMEKASGRAETFRQCTDLVREKFEIRKKVRTILGIRNRPVLESTDRVGRWHTDSFRKQIKVFCFLNDVSEKTGPLQVIGKTNGIRFKLLHGILRQNYFGVLPKRNFKFRKYACLNETFIESMLKDSRLQSKLFSVETGTIVICDTSCIHRASPCEEGERYALTAYI